jgi:hypothetical protein
VDWVQFLFYEENGMKKALVVLAVLFLNAAGFAQQQGLPRLAVVELSTNMNTEKTRADSVAVRNLVESQMIGTGKYQIVTRSEIDQLLSNQQIQVSSISSADNVKKLQLQNISYIVTGSVDAMGSDYAVTVKILDVSTGQFSHSANAFMGGSSRDLYIGVNTLVINFVKGMSSEGGQVAQVAPAVSQRPGSGVRAADIGIEVSTKVGGVLYFQGEEVTTLWENDTYTIPIERPGTYTVKIVFGNGAEKTRGVAITTRGVTKVDFSLYIIGDTGPGGGMVFYDKGYSGDGWSYLEAAPAGTEFTASWGLYGTTVSGTNTGIGTGKRNTQIVADRGGTAAQRCIAMNIGGYNDWFLPSKDELNLMYTNLKAKGLGGFSDNWYLSSSERDNSYTWLQRFSNGAFDTATSNKNYMGSVRAVRAF